MKRVRPCGLRHEFGATTGRPRRCGWLDLPALKHACMLNGATQLCMMKADVLDAFDEVQVCTHYELDGETSEHLPYLLEEGWSSRYSSPARLARCRTIRRRNRVARFIARLRQGNRVA